MRRVVWSRESRSDLLDIVAFVSEDNPPAARRIIDNLETVGNSLGRMATGRPGRVSGTYEKIMNGLPYILAYALRTPGIGVEEVYILRIIHTARDWPEQNWPD